MAQLSFATLARAFFTKPSNFNISIGLDNTGFKPYYASGDRIQGVVTVTVDKPVQFSHVNLMFEGSTQVTLPQPETVLRHCEASHKFLQLHHPIKEDCIAAGVFQPGLVYTFPYIFVVPERLLPGSCTHPTNDHEVHQTHTQLPPTLRVANVSQVVCQVAYAIKFTISRQISEDGSLHHKRETLASETRHVRVIPTTDRKATSPSGGSPNYAYFSSLSQDKAHRRRVEWPLTPQRCLKGRLGALCSTSLSATATEIQSSISEYHHAMHTTYSATTTVYLRFDPGAQTEEPPRIRKISPTLRTTTYYSTIPRRVNQQQIPYGGSHVETIPLTSLGGTSLIQWTRHHTNPPAANQHQYVCSGNKDDEENMPIIGDEPRIDHYYIAAIEVPVSLPKKKGGQAEFLLPTFHSCYISRVYVLELCVSFCSPNRTRLPQSTVVEVPALVTRRTRPSCLGQSMETLCERKRKTMSSLSFARSPASCGRVSITKGPEQMELPLLPDEREPPQLPSYADAVSGG